MFRQYIVFVLSLTFMVNAAADPLYPGGAASGKIVSGKNVYSQHSANLPIDEVLNFNVGNGFFRKKWIPAPASTNTSDGLGPLFNAVSCQSCHVKDGRGLPPNENTMDQPNNRGFVIQLENENQESNVVKGDPVYGSQFQDQAVPGGRNEGFVLVKYVAIPMELKGEESVELRYPKYSLVNLGFGPLFQRVRLRPRVAPPMIGLGLLESVPEDEILSFADEQDSNEDGISGKPNWAYSLSEQETKLGRFGWKANSPTIKDQTAVAFSADLGLSTSLLRVPHGDCTESQTDCLNAAHGSELGSLEISDEILDVVVFYSSNLAVPRSRTEGAETYQLGAGLFEDVGCSGCHRPSMKTGGESSLPVQYRNQIIWPYSDLLLHDMGEGLSDSGSEGIINKHEWRTQPLWGIGLAKEVHSDIGFLHDGRAQTIQEAILWHDGEAKSSRENYQKLSSNQRQELLDFLHSI